MYPREKNVQKKTLFRRILNELSENLIFDSEFVLVFEIRPFKVAAVFLTSIFQSIPELNGFMNLLQLLSFFSISPGALLSTITLRVYMEMYYGITFKFST